MWFLLLAAPIALTTTTTVAKTTGALRLLTFGGISVLGWNQSHGHRPGEGRLTDRANGYFGIKADMESDFDLNQGLGLLAAMLPSDFEPYMGRAYDMTDSESEMLRALVSNAIDDARNANEARQMLKQRPNHKLTQDVVTQTYLQLRKSTTPLLKYLEKFPRRRVKRVA